MDTSNRKQLRKAHQPEADRINNASDEEE